MLYIISEEVQFMKSELHILYIMYVFVMIKKASYS